MNSLKNAKYSLYLYRNGYLNTLDKERFISIVGNSVLFRLRIVLTNTLKEFKLLFVKNPALDIEGKIVCIINSKNNYESLKFLNSPEVVYLKPTVLGDNVENVKTFRFKAKIFYSLIFIICLPYILLDKLNRRDLILLHKAFGLTNLFSSLIKKQKPRQVVFANDHIPDARSFILACKNAGVKTAYIQHGSVSKYFPPLVFDLALLESQYSKDIYTSNKKYNSRIELIGIPKLDIEISKIRDRKVINTVGVAINQNDDLQKVEKLVEALIHNDYKVILRKHPADIRKVASLFDIQDGNSMSVFDFIHGSDFIVASDSSIHVEANSLKCRSVYYQLHDNYNKYDYYGFIKNEYVEEVRDEDMLIEVLKSFNYSSFSFNTSSLAYYNEALKNDYYGKSSLLAQKFIYESIDH